MIRRVVLAPHGLPQSPDARERCSELLLRCGGDLCRVIEGPPRSLREYADYVASIRNLREGAEPALVVMSRITPVSSLLAIRATLEERVPAMTAAPWILYADAQAEPDCYDELRKHGTLRGALWDAPLWTDSEGGAYLVLSPHLRKSAEYGLGSRLLGDAGSIPTRSTFRSLRRPSRHPTVRVPVFTDERPTVIPNKTRSA